jgi:hypothetical protein
MQAAAGVSALFMLLAAVTALAMFRGLRPATQTSG